MALRNLITDVAGVTVGHADDAKIASGVTAVVFDEPAVASIDVRGGGTGTRESVLLDPSMTVERIDALVLAGGSAFGLDAAAGAMAQLAEQGRGFHQPGVMVAVEMEQTESGSEMIEQRALVAKEQMRCPPAGTGAGLIDMRVVGRRRGAIGSDDRRIIVSGAELNSD